MEVTNELLRQLVGDKKFTIWTELRELIESLYALTPQWNPGGKRWMHECKYRKGDKTLCTLYARENTIGFMIIFGAAEREKFESERASFSAFIQTNYDAATTYHDGKWLMLELDSTECFEDLRRLLVLKRKPIKENL